MKVAFGWLSLLLAILLGVDRSAISGEPVAPSDTVAMGDRINPGKCDQDDFKAKRKCVREQIELLQKEEAELTAAITGVQVALLSFYADAEGALNLVLLVLAPPIGKKASKNFFDKLQLVEDTVAAMGARRLGHAAGITRLRHLRNGIEHWKPGTDLELSKTWNAQRSRGWP